MPSPGGCDTQLLITIVLCKSKWPIVPVLLRRTFILIAAHSTTFRDECLGLTLQKAIFVYMEQMLNQRCFIIKVCC
jgi:hypothetical protein